jgi:Tfp pilus assembly protein PilN
MRILEVKDNQIRIRVMVLNAFSVGILILALFYTALNIISMQRDIAQEQQRLDVVEAEYRKYKATTTIVDKSDLELLDKLQRDRIYWTKVLASMAFHLPNNAPNPYWITKLSYNNDQFKIHGFGYISPMQEQLITIDDYLNQLRADSSYSYIFKNTYLNSTSRSDEGKKERVDFEFSSLRKGVRAQ